MDATALQAVALVGAVLGVASHLGYFIRGDHNMHGTRILIALIVVPAFLFITVLKLHDNGSYLAAGQVTATAFISYLGSLITSILTYRAFFHPLRNFPGPFSLKLSKLFHTSRIAKESRNHILADSLFKQYGEFVRVGPNELITNSPEGINAVLGLGSKCSKAPWYECIIYPHTSLHMTPSKVIHDKRRRVWDRAFTTKALRDYEGRVRNYTGQLISGLTSNVGKSINAARWFNYFSFDIMGDMAFGKPFDMLKTGEKHNVIELLQESMKPLGILSPVPWLFPILMDIPGLNAGPKEFKKYSKEHIDARKQLTPESPDLFSWLIDAEKQSNDPIHKDPRWLVGDCQLVVVAGSDTTAATLTHIFYHLARLPEVFSKLRAELDAFYQPGAETEFKDLQSAPYLNGVINEALRLHPPVPSGLLRVTPPQGITIGSTYIPGNVTISTPFYTIGRLESCYKNATEFVPERWGEKPEMVLQKSVFVPFSLGPYGCVGKQLALMELRNVTARVVTELDVGFAPGEDGTNLLEKSKDNFTLELASLHLIFSRRKN